MSLIQIPIDEQISVPYSDFKRFKAIYSRLHWPVKSLQIKEVKKNNLFDITRVHVETNY
jgi:hypothetical protein